MDAATTAKPHEGRPAPLFIDLNEAPPPPCDTPPADPPVPGFHLDARALACRFHGNLAPAPGPAADFPGEAGVGPVLLCCGICGRPETRGGTVVCDGCERGFHLSCVRNRLRPPAGAVDDWLCFECSANGRPIKRWTLGAARLLDINALPPSEGDFEELQTTGNVGFRVSCSDGANVSGYCQPFPRYNVGQIRNDFDLGKDTASLDDSVRITEDGKRFGSVHDGAQNVGTKSSFTYIDIGEKGGGSGIVQRPLPPRRRKRDIPRIWTATSSSDNQDSMRASCGGGEPSSDTEVMESQFIDFKRPLRASSAYVEENSGHGSQNFSDWLPVQFEDFFVICFGRIDLRMAYHNSTHIWPVGYRSVWHDKITGSLFECEVSDGGNAGPVFKVRRHPCSALPIPIGATVLLYNSANKSDEPEITESSSVIHESSLDKDNDILMLLLDPSDMHHEQISCISCDVKGISRGSSAKMDLDGPVGSPRHLDNYSEVFNESSKRSSNMRDVIGDFYVEGRSSSLVWKMVSQTLVDSCREVYKQSGSLQFFCRHRCQIPPLHADAREKSLDRSDTLARFCSSAGSKNIPYVIQNDTELDSLCKSLAEWLNQDRFGLEFGFVQEVIEILPESHACSAYQFLINRNDVSKSTSVASGAIKAIQKNGDRIENKIPSHGLYKSSKLSQPLDFAAEHQPSVRQPPPGKSCSRRLPPELVGDVYQIWEFLWRFYDTLGLDEPPSLEELEEELFDPWPIDSKYMEEIEKEIHDSTEPVTRLNDNQNLLSAHGPDSSSFVVSPPMFIPNETASAREAAQAKLAARTYGRCSGLKLSKVHISLLKILIGEILGKLAIFVDPNYEARESKSRRGRKKEVDSTLTVKEAKTDILPANELTWPDLARRYILAVLSMNFVMDSPDIFSREGLKLVRCLYGDGGVLCGSLSGVAGMEADAVLLAEAERQISYSTKQEKEFLPIDQKEPDAVGSSEPAVLNEKNLPEWALPLEPVKKLPTNVGTRIRKCIYDALERNPPEWAKKVLEHSISKEVYKGNASGPTKKAVLSVLAEASGGKNQQKPLKRSKEKNPISLSDAVMKRCRILLRRAVSADEGKVFCNLLGSPIANVNDNEDEGILGYPAMVSRPLDFRTIDLRVAVGAYGGSHEAFLEDVREVWRNLSTAYGDRPDLMQLVGTLSQNFESLYEKEVLNLVEKIVDHVSAEALDTGKQKELYDILQAENEIPKAPWEEGVCKVCGIDKDDDSVLLCDTCDSEYHTYCLDPPLARIPEGNWYCPSCVGVQSKKQDLGRHSLVNKDRVKRHLGEDGRAFQESLNQLACTMEEREYWEYSAEERILLLKFLCDEVLNTGLIREHLDQCTDKSNDIQQRLRTLVAEWRNLKSKEEILVLSIAKESANKLNEPGHVAGGDGEANLYSNHGKPGECQHNENILKNSSSTIEDCYALDKHSMADNVFPNVTVGREDKRTQREQLILVSSEQDCKGAREESNSGLLGKESSISDRINVAQTLNMGAVALTNSDALHGSSLGSDKAIIHARENDISPGRGSLNGSEELVTSNCVLPGNTDEIYTTSIQRMSSDLETLRVEISHLEEAISSLESQLMVSCLRRDSLGRDSLGRLYWVINKPGKRPWLVADGSVMVPQDRKQIEDSKDPKGDLTDIVSHTVSSRAVQSGSDACSTSVCDLQKWSYCSFSFYESDNDIIEITSWLSNADPKERELKEGILQWQKFLHQVSDLIFKKSQPIAKSSMRENCIITQRLTTNATMILESKYGPFLEPEATEIPKKKGRKGKSSHEERMFRCECLEPIWPSKHHCLTCHHSFPTLMELERHNDGRCSLDNLGSDESKASDDIKMKGTRTESIWGKETLHEVDIVEMSKCSKLDANSNFIRISTKACPYNLDTISKTFITKNSNKELMQEIGLLGVNGVPSFVPSSGFFLNSSEVLSPSLTLDTNINTEFFFHSDACLMPSVLEGGIGTDTTKDETRKGGRQVNISSHNILGNVNDEVSQRTKIATPGTVSGEETSSITSKIQQFEVSGNCTIPESSLRPLVGKTSEILRQLKINLLDMEAALPVEALRPSKSQLLRRSAWRTFVKSSESIFELVQATTLLEDMIKTDTLKHKWWYWSSQTAAAKTSTVSSLALRIYALDDSIIYFKDQAPSSDPSDSLRLTTKSGKKRKDTE